MQIIVLRVGYVVFVGIFQGNREREILGGEPFLLFCGISIDFHEITSRKFRTVIVFRTHFRNIHAVFLHFYLVAKLIRALIFAIEHNVYHSSRRSILHSHHFAYSERQQIPHQSFVAVVVYQRPLFCSCRHTEQSRFVGEFEFVGLFGKYPRAVSSAANVQTVGKYA